MKIPLIDISGQHEALSKELKKAAAQVLDSNEFILKKNVAELERRMAEKVGARHAVALASGSDALYLSLLALGVGSGDEVITTPFTFFATAGSISRTGARPVFADIGRATFNLDPALLEAKITPKTKAIIPVHLFGLACDMDAIQRIAKKHSLAVVEDAAQSFGAVYDGKFTGAIGDAGCYSFYPTKNLGGMGDGGMAVTSSGEVAEKLRVLRDHGSRRKYYHDIIGINSRLDEIQAAFLLVKLKHIDHWNRLRQKHAADYEKGLKGLPVRTPAVPKDGSHIFHLYSILTIDREKLMNHLLTEEIGAGVYYPLPLHLQACYKALGYKKGDFPIAEGVSEQILSLPMFPELSDAAKKAVISAVRSFFKNEPRTDF